MSDVILPIVDLDVFLSAQSDQLAVLQECQKVRLVFWPTTVQFLPLPQAADALITYGALLLHDSRVSEEDNDVFLDLIEDYFAQPEAELRKDERPELGYQVSILIHILLAVALQLVLIGRCHPREHREA